LLLNCGFHISSILSSQEKTEQAIECLKDLERLFPTIPIILSALGAAYKEIGQMEDALKYFRKAYDTSPDHAETVLIYSRVLLSTGKKEDKREALRVLRAATTSRFSDAPAEVHMLFAQTLEDIKQYKQAADAVKKVISLEPRNANARVYLAKLYLKMKAYPPAVKLLNQARDMQPYDSEAALYHGKALYSLGKLEAAEKALKDALSLNPTVGHGEAHKILGKIASKQSKWEDACFHYEALISSRPNDPEAYIRGSAADEKCSKVDTANDKLSRAVGIWSLKSQAFFEKHPEDLNALKNLSSRCVAGSVVPSESVCYDVKSILNRVVKEN
jgi:tetratricopeptide (TPR) repeat protein